MAEGSRAWVALGMLEDGGMRIFQSVLIGLSLPRRLSDLNQSMGLPVRAPPRTLLDRLHTRAGMPASGRNWHFIDEIQFKVACSDRYSLKGRDFCGDFRRQPKRDVHGRDRPRGC